MAVECKHCHTLTHTYTHIYKETDSWTSVRMALTRSHMCLLKTLRSTNAWPLALTGAVALTLAFRVASWSTCMHAAAKSIECLLSNVWCKWICLLIMQWPKRCCWLATVLDFWLQVCFNFFSFNLLYFYFSAFIDAFEANFVDE